MGSSSFAAMIRLKFVSTTRASLTSMPSPENVSIDRGSDYRACPYWLFSTKPGAPPLAHMFRNLHQHLQVWRQWWLQHIYPIKIGSWHHPSSTCLCNYPDGSPYLMWYGPDGLGVWHVLMLRWRIVKISEGVCHTLSCDVLWPGLLFCR